MKKTSILMAILMIFATGVMAQKSKMREAKKALSSGKLGNAKKAIDAAFADGSLAQDPKTYFIKGQVYQSIAGDISGLFKNLDDDAASKSYEAYMKTLEYDKKGKYKKKVKKMLTNLIPLVAQQGAQKYKDNKFKKAADLFEKALEIGKSELIEAKGIDTAMIFNTALASEKAKDYDRAIKYYKQAKEYGYQEAQSYARLSYVLKQAGKKDESTAVLEEGSKKYPNDLSIIFELINVNLLGGTPEKAEKYVDKAIALEPNNASLYRAKASIFEKTGDIKKAKELYNKALSIDPKDFTSQYNLAIMLLKDVEKFRKEVNDIEDAKKYNAGVKDLLNRYESIIPYFEKAYKLNPEEKGSIQILKELYFKLRDKSPKYMENYKKYKALYEK